MTLNMKMTFSKVILKLSAWLSRSLEAIETIQEDLGNFSYESTAGFMNFHIIEKGYDIS